MIKERDKHGKTPFHLFFEAQREHFDFKKKFGQQDNEIHPLVWSFFEILEETGAIKVIDKTVSILPDPRQP